MNRELVSYMRQYLTTNIRATVFPRVEKRGQNNYFKK